MKKELFRKYAKALLVGLLRALQGTVAMATLALGVVASFCVTQESGYLAVGMFLVALLIFAGGLVQLYNFGRNIAGGNKKGEQKK